MSMKDRNGVEIRSGDIVQITGAFFKNDNGYYFVANSPGDPTWCGSDYSLHRISKSGKISTAKYRLCFWPIKVFTNSISKRKEAKAWNDVHAQVEVVEISNTTEVVDFFKKKAKELEAQIKRAIWDVGEEHPTVTSYKAMQDHYNAVAQYVAIKGQGAPADEVVAKRVSYQLNHILLHYGYQVMEDGDVYHAFEATDLKSPPKEGEMEIALADALDTTQDDDRYSYGTMEIILPDSIVERIKQEGVREYLSTMEEEDR